MKIITTAVLLCITLLAVPLFTYFFGTALGPLEWKALKTLVTIAVLIALVCFVLGELTGNYSQTDKIWSIAPVIYVWVVAAYGELTPRLILMAVLVTLWGIRLTGNFALKGAYRWRFWSGEEDHRWKVLRQKKEFQPRWKWTLFNLFFISGYQNALILLFTLPTIVVLQNPDAPLVFMDFLAAGLMLFFLFYETVADIQHWNFQSRKHALIKAGKELNGDFKKGFLDKGLWGYSRHPNYFAEQAIWFGFYLFSIAAGGQWFNWSIAGSLLLIVLFQGSSAFGEEISARKYPDYKEYQKSVPRFIPFLKRK